MTPEAIAGSILDPEDDRTLGPQDADRLRQRIADTIRAAAADEDLRRQTRSEIERILKTLCELAKCPPPIINAAWGYNCATILENMRELARRITQENGGVVIIPTDHKIEAAPSPSEALLSLLDRLAFLLGLSDTERAFIRDYDSRRDRTTWLIFADWLEEQGAQQDVIEGFRRLVPRSGDVLVFQPQPRAQLPDYQALRRVVLEVQEQQRQMGREVFCIVLPPGHSLERIDATEMNRQGWIKIEAHEEAYRLLAETLVGEPECETESLVSVALLRMIERLKRQNAEMELLLRAHRARNR